MQSTCSSKHPLGMNLSMPWKGGGGETCLVVKFIYIYLLCVVCGVCGVCVCMCGVCVCVCVCVCVMHGCQVCMWRSEFNFVECFFLPPCRTHGSSSGCCQAW